jgi:hypothetical protein
MPPPTVPDRPTDFYLLLFGSDAGPLRPARTHTWATYVKAADRRILAQVTVSWFPADLAVNPGRAFRPEAGVNLSLADTFRVVAEQKQAATAFGPYRIDEARYAVAETERELLESGKVSYRAASAPRGMPAGLANCVTAVGSVEPAVGRKLGLFQFGRRGTARAAQDLQADGGVAKVEADWLFAELGLDRLPHTRHR